MTVDVDNVLKDLRAAAKYFLLAEESFGAESMLQATDGLIALSSHLPPQAQHTLNQLVGQAFAAQQRHDLIGLADYLNVELYDFIQQLDKQSVN